MSFISVAEMFFILCIIPKPRPRRWTSGLIDQRGKCDSESQNSSPLLGAACYCKTNRRLSALPPKLKHNVSFHVGVKTLGDERGRRKKKRKIKGAGWFVYLVGFARELAAAELALDLALGAVVLQVVGQVAARQLDGAAVGAGDDVEGAGGEVALEEGRRRDR